MAVTYNQPQKPDSPPSNSNTTKMYVYSRGPDGLPVLHRDANGNPIEAEPNFKGPAFERYEMIPPPHMPLVPESPQTKPPPPPPPPRPNGRPPTPPPPARNYAIEPLWAAPQPTSASGSSRGFRGFTADGRILTGDDSDDEEAAFKKKPKPQFFQASKGGEIYCWPDGTWREQKPPQ
ncbi:hypothetical protein EDC01DRAFT_747251 [Geopyxis carbonaria]|nr:hypothetical protein EDC01DRAFT_747251 [Geopyxis carbonaria]